MKSNKVIGMMLLVLAVLTIAGMVMKNNTYWTIYDCAVVIFSLLSGIILLKQK